MFTINKTTSYTINAILYLAQYSQNRFVLSAEIAKKEKIPSFYLAKILLRLSKQGMIISIKGRNGGYKLGAKGLNSSIKDILAIVEGPSFIDNCILRQTKCNEAKRCELHDDWTTIRYLLEKDILSKSISDLTKNAGRK